MLLPIDLIIYYLYFVLTSEQMKRSFLSKQIHDEKQRILMYYNLSAGSHKINNEKCFMKF